MREKVGSSKNKNRICSKPVANSKALDLLCVQK